MESSHVPSTSTQTLVQVRSRLWLCHTSSHWYLFQAVAFKVTMSCVSSSCRSTWKRWGNNFHPQVRLNPLAFYNSLIVAVIILFHQDRRNKHLLQNNRKSQGSDIHPGLADSVRSVITQVFFFFWNHFTVLQCTNNGYYFTIYMIK